MKKSTKFLISLLVLAVVPGCFAFAKSKLIDKVTERVMNTFNVPGVAVAVVKDGKIVHMKGYGVTSLAGKALVDENTLFAIASNSKAFTGAAL